MEMGSNEKETVAIIGGGIAGLSCAHFLSKSSRFVPTVFDTGRLRPGGRCSSRLPGDKPKEDQIDIFKAHHVVDHAAQILTVPNLKGFDEFKKQVQEWEQQGVITPYPDNTVCNILDSKGGDHSTSDFTLEPVNSESSQHRMYYGTNGMGSIPLAIQKSSDFELQQDVWVSPSNGVRYMKNEKKQRWKLQANGKLLGKFDQIVIAHNGKCADRIMSRTPAKKLHSLLRVNFAPTVQKWGGNKMTLNSVYSLTFCLDKENNALSKVLPKDRFVCGFIRNEPTLRFLSCQTRKYGGEDDAEKEVWTLLSSPNFAKKYKAPQEFLPGEVIMNVTNLMMRGLEKSLNLQTGSLGLGLDEKATKSNSRLQLWGAGVPLNTWKSADQDKNVADGGFLYDCEHSVGVCGDWLVDASIGGAWESGRRLAEFMSSTDGSRTAGLEGRFQRSEAVQKAGLGSLVTKSK